MTEYLFAIYFIPSLATFDDPAQLTHDDVQKPTTTEVEEMLASTRMRSGMRQSRIENIRSVEVDRLKKDCYFNLFNSL